MRLEFDSLERYASLDGPLQRLDARIKVLVTLALIVASMATPVAGWGWVGVQGIVLAALVVVSRVPAWVLLRRWLGVVLVVGVFAALVARAHPARAEHGVWAVGGTLLARNALATLATLLLVHVTRQNDLFNAMRRLKVPGVLVTTLQLMVRYLAVFADELERMMLARRSRTFRRRGSLGPSTLASLISVLFLRAVERGDRVHSAMVSRGWDGTWRTLDGPDAP